MSIVEDLGDGAAALRDEASRVRTWHVFDSDLDVLPDDDPTVVDAASASDAALTVAKSLYEDGCMEEAYGFRVVDPSTGAEALIKIGCAWTPRWTVEDDKGIRRIP